MKRDRSGVCRGRWPVVWIVSVARAVEVLNVHRGGLVGLVDRRRRGARWGVGRHARYWLSWRGTWRRDMDSE